MEDILEAITTVIKEIIKFLIFTVTLNILLLNLGRFTLLGITLGKYPTFEQAERDAGKIIWFGVFLIIATWTAIAAYNNLNT